MNKFVIIFADENEEYLGPLEIKFLREFGNQIDLQVISDKEYFNNFFSDMRTIDILLISEELFSVHILKHNIRNTFVLTENSSEIEDKEGVHYTYKYSSVKKLYNEVLHVSSKNMDILKHDKQETKVVAVSSASGGTGKTTVALGLAGILAENHMRTIYIDAEYLQSFHCRLKEQSVIPARICVEMQTNRNNIYTTLKTYIKNEHCDYLMPFCADMGSLGLDFSLYGMIIETIRKTQEYDYIIVDTDKTFNKEKFSLLKLANKVILVQKPDKISMFETNRLLENMSISDNDKFLFVCNQCGPLHHDMTNDTKYSVCGYIDQYDQEQLLTIEEIIKIEGIKKLLYLL